MSSNSIPNPQLPPPGWYPDPVTAGQERVWDGARWTEQIRPIPNQTAHPVAAPLPAGYQQAGYGYPSSDQGYQQTAYGYGMARRGPTTDDGVPLAGWWARFGALIIDSMLMGMVTAVAAVPFYEAFQAGFNAWFADAMHAAQVGGQVPVFTDPKYGLAGPYWTIMIISIAVNFVYSAGLQIWRGGTLGMQALGLRVVPAGHGREHHGLPVATAVVRNVVFQALGLVPLLETINGLVPLVNPRRQTVHDMIGRTQVVKIR